MIRITLILTCCILWKSSFSQNIVVSTNEDYSIYEGLPNKVEIASNSIPEKFLVVKTTNGEIHKKGKHYEWITRVRDSALDFSGIWDSTFLLVYDSRKDLRKPIFTRKYKLITLIPFLIIQPTLYEGTVPNFSEMQGLSFERYRAYFSLIHDQVTNIDLSNKCKILSFKISLKDSIHMIDTVFHFPENNLTKEFKDYVSKLDCKVRIEFFEIMARIEWMAKAPLLYDMYQRHPNIYKRLCY